MKRGPVQKFSIYVLEYRRKGYSEPYFYVGSTVDLAKRLAEHRAKPRTYPFVYRRDLSRPRACMTRATAERLERELAARLRRRGWEVEQS